MSPGATALFILVSATNEIYVMKWVSLFLMMNSGLN